MTSSASMKFDLVVIGGGSAGHAAARTAAELGLSCVLVEAPGPLGGLCILRGCMPSKVLLETSNRMREIHEAKRFGITIGEPKLNLGALRNRLEELTKDFREYRLHEMQSSGYQLIRATASFVSPHELSLIDEEKRSSNLAAKAFVIATGSFPSIPKIPGLEGTPYWTSDDVVRMPAVPSRIAIIGSGAIGLEMAHLFEGFGSKVTVIARGGSILSHHDPDLAKALLKESKERGIKFLRNTSLRSVKHEKDQFHLALEGEASSLTVDALLIATGREPATAKLELENIGIAMDGKRILIDDRATTSLSHIFAAGDCASPVPVVHLAVIQGEAAARNAERIIRDGHSELSADWSYSTAMSGLFTEPQCVEIGLTEKPAAVKGISTIAGIIHYNDQGKGMIAGSRHGFVKIVADASTRRIIGASGVGPGVLETSHVVQMAITSGLTLEEYVAVPHYHPTLAEAWASAAQDAIDQHPQASD